jgi:phage FluMu protein Com
MHEVRCEKCNKLLYKKDYCGGHIEVIKNKEEPWIWEGYIPVIYIKCPRCGEMNTKKESVEDEGEANR